MQIYNNLLKVQKLYFFFVLFPYAPFQASQSVVSE